MYYVEESHSQIIAKVYGKNEFITYIMVLYIILYNILDEIKRGIIWHMMLKEMVLN